MKLIVNDKIFQEIERLQIGVVVMTGVDNSRKIGMIREKLGGTAKIEILDGKNNSMKLSL